MLTEAERMADVSGSFRDGWAIRRHALLSERREAAWSAYRSGSKALGNLVARWNAYRDATTALMAFEDSLDKRLLQAIRAQQESPDPHPATAAARADPSRTPARPLAAGAAASNSGMRLDEAEAIARDGVAGAAMMQPRGETA